MYRIGLILGPAVFFIGVVDWILRLAHFTDLIEKTLPVTEKMTSPTGIWVTMIVGILIFLAAWAERKRERDQERKYEERKPSEAGSPTSSIGTIAQKANPVNTVDASQKVEIHNHPPVVPPLIPPPTLQPEKRATRPTFPQQATVPKHNVKFLGGEAYNPDRHGNFAGSPSGQVKCILAEFRNKHIVGKTVSPAHYVKAGVTHKDKTDKEILYISPCSWHGHDSESKTLDPGAGSSWLILAVYDYSESRWMAVRAVSGKDYTTDVYGVDELRWETKPLPFGVLTTEIVLLEEDGKSLEGGRVEFELKKGGEFEILTSQ